MVKPSKFKSRLNERIRSKTGTIELIDEQDVHHTEYSLTEALQRAADLQLDLVELNFNPIKPVCKIMNYGKYQYEQSRQESAKRKQQNNSQEKEIQITTQTQLNDLEIRANKARKELLAGNKIRIVLTCRGRTAIYKDTANIQFFVDRLADISKVVQAPDTAGRKITCKLAPVST